MSAGVMLRPEPAEFAQVNDIASAQAVFHAWLFGQALPFWSGVGHEGGGRGAREHLQLDGSAAAVPFKRMRVQARQIYAFSHAALLGWADGERLARDGYGFITGCGEKATGGWVRVLSAAGDGVLDAAVDLYDQAFVLLALAWYARLTGSAEALQRARRTVAWIRTHMAVAPCGFHNAVPVEAGPRQQNPHMHLLEAALALYETSGDSCYATLAHDLVDLFRGYLFDRETGTVGELFLPNWSPVPGGRVEPGHQYEWVWLLHQYERQTGIGVSTEIDRLFRFAREYGTDAKTALVWDGVNRDGSAPRRSTRLWPQTEALKAHVAMVQRGAGGGMAIPGIVRNLGTRFFTGCPAGAWIDHFDAAGQPIVDKIPTSSFYHVFMAYTELAQLTHPAVVAMAGGLTADGRPKSLCPAHKGEHQSAEKIGR
jgi:mannose-6-phosphate isomerase